MTDNNPGCFTPFLRLFGLDKKRAEKHDVLPYCVRDDFLSKAETAFYQVLKATIGDGLVIFAKVSLKDLFFVFHPNVNRSICNKINQKHVDFLLCNSKTLKPTLAIELDESSHNRPERIDRDAFVDEVFKAAHLLLVHIPVQRAYNTQELRASIE